MDDSDIIRIPTWREVVQEIIDGKRDRHLHETKLEVGEFVEFFSAPPNDAHGTVETYPEPNAIQVMVVVSEVTEGPHGQWFFQWKAAVPFQQPDPRLTGEGEKFVILSAVQQFSEGTATTIPALPVSWVTGYPLRDVDDAFEILAAAGHLRETQTTAGLSAVLTARGRQFLKDYARRTTAMGIAEGDVVQFANDAQPMCVEFIDTREGGTATCVWHREGEMSRQTFSLVTLRKTETMNYPAYRHLPIEEGDDVSLRSGGPLMIIESINREIGTAAKCLWHINGVVKRATVAIHTLVKQDRKLLMAFDRAHEKSKTRKARKAALLIPPEIRDSLANFQAEHPDPRKAAFIMMRFTETDAHSEIVRVIQGTMAKHGIEAMRADHKEYHDDTFSNIKTYMNGCGFGIAIFERIEEEAFNPNVGLEVGYMMALSKPVLLLKDKTLKTLHADLNGKLYKSFDTRDPGATLPSVIEKWLKDKGYA